MGFEVFLARINNRRKCEERGEYGRVDGSDDKETLSMEVKVVAKMEVKMAVNMGVARGR